MGGVRATPRGGSAEGGGRSGTDRPGPASPQERHRHHELLWADALVEFAVPLRAMRAFYGVRYLREALPDWAANDVIAM